MASNGCHKSLFLGDIANGLAFRRENYDTALISAALLDSVRRTDWSGYKSTARAYSLSSCITIKQSPPRPSRHHANPNIKTTMYLTADFLSATLFFLLTIGNACDSHRQLPTIHHSNPSRPLRQQQIRLLAAHFLARYQRASLEIWNLRMVHLPLTMILLRGLI